VRQLAHLSQPCHLTFGVSPEEPEHGLGKSSSVGKDRREICARDDQYGATLASWFSIRGISMQVKHLMYWCLLLTVTICGAVFRSWGHDVGEPGLEKLPIWSKCCGGGDCISQRLRIIGKEPGKKVAVEIEGVQTSVDKEKFSPVPTNRTWVCYVSLGGAISNENIRCILYPQKSGTT
jgi:hypothetical protein